MNAGFPIPLIGLSSNLVGKPIMGLQDLINSLRPSDAYMRR